VLSAASTTGVKLPVEVITLPVSWPGRRLAGLTVCFRIEIDLLRCDGVAASSHVTPPRT
jgi:hypothetical protein